MLSAYGLFNYSVSAKHLLKRSLVLYVILLLFIMLPDYDSSQQN